MRLDGKCLYFLIWMISYKLTLIGETLDPLLVDLGLPVTGSFAVRKVRFFNYIGLGHIYRV